MHLNAKAAKNSQRTLSFCIKNKKKNLCDFAPLRPYKNPLRSPVFTPGASALKRIKTQGRKEFAKDAEVLVSKTKMNLCDFAPLRPN